MERLTVTINPDASPAPDYVVELGEALPAIVRALNHQTRDHAAMDHPSDADRLLRDLEMMAFRLPQLCGQVSAWLEREQAAGRIEMAAGAKFPDPAQAAEVVAMHLKEAQAAAKSLRLALHMAASVTTDMAGAGDE